MTRASDILRERARVAREQDRLRDAGLHLGRQVVEWLGHRA